MPLEANGSTKDPLRADHRRSLVQFSSTQLVVPGGYHFKRCTPRTAMKSNLFAALEFAVRRRPSKQTIENGFVHVSAPRMDQAQVTLK